jgi:hypothetical protein
MDYRAQRRIWRKIFISGATNRQNSRSRISEEQAVQKIVSRIVPNLPEEKAVSISMIFKWYESDLGVNRHGLIDTLLAFLDEGDKKAFLIQNRDRVRIRFQPYNWNLNQEITSKPSINPF